MSVPPGPVFREAGSGTTDDPKIKWIVEPPKSQLRVDKIEKVAKELGVYGYTHVWLRYQRKKIQTDNHLTVFAGKGTEATADQQGHVYIAPARSGWRIMQDNERVLPGSEDMKGIEMYKYPYP